MNIFNFANHIDQQNKPEIGLLTPTLTLHNKHLQECYKHKAWPWPIDL